MIVATHFPFLQTLPGGQQMNPLGVSHTCFLLQQRPLMHVSFGPQHSAAPVLEIQHVSLLLQQRPRPSGPIQQCELPGQQNRSLPDEQTCSRGQHLPLTHTVPSGQQKRSLWNEHACRRGQHLPLMQIVPCGQHTGIPVAVEQIDSGRQHSPLMQTVSGGQHVTVPSER